MAELPAEAVAHFELQELNVGGNKIRNITQEALASCHSLKILNLPSTGLTKLPLGFLAAMPRLQRLNLAGNQLQSPTLCMNETRHVRTDDSESGKQRAARPASGHLLLFTMLERTAASGQRAALPGGATLPKSTATRDLEPG